MFVHAVSKPSHLKQPETLPCPVSLPPFFLLAEIGDLATLLRLDLSHNSIEILPATIGKLSSLKFLDLSHNILRALPLSSHSLSSLTSLSLAANPSSQPPPDVAAAGARPVVAYMRALNSFATGAPVAMARCGIQYFPLAVVQPIPLELYAPLGLAPVDRGIRGGGKEGGQGERGKSASSSGRILAGLHAVDGELVVDDGDGTPEARARRRSSVMRLGMISFDDDQGGDNKGNRVGVIDAENEDVNNRVVGGSTLKDVFGAGEGFTTLDVAGGRGGGGVGLFPPIKSLSLDTNALRSLPEADR
jgi:hypothetical protein